MNKMFRKTRIKYASKFGKLEHLTGRWMGVAIFITCICSFFESAPLSMTCALIALGLWITYLTSHTLEKKFYGHFGPRG